MEQVTTNRDKLVADAKTVLDDVETLLKQAAAASGQQAHDLRERANEALQRVKLHLRDAQGVVAENTRAAARATEHWVHEHPWGAVGIAAGVGFLLGLLISRR
jgi:ElaB/YqjD/DUF883 family membrane-anchored ribosome-binding protein